MKPSLLLFDFPPSQTPCVYEHFKADVSCAPVKKTRFRETLVGEDPRTQYRSFNQTSLYQNPKFRVNSVTSKILNLRGELFDS